MVTVEISGKLPSGITEGLVNKLAYFSVKLTKFRRKSGVSISLVGDAEIRRLNKRWRGIDRVTDVLSFNYRDESGFAAAAAGRPGQLGDIVISLPQVRRQAKAIGRPASQELALMIVHGLLHLLGCDHATRREEEGMFGLQQEVLMRSGVL